MNVPQSLIVGPNLSILYVNDICKTSSIVHAIIYADDTTLTSNLEEISAKSERRFITVYSWIQKEIGKHVLKTTVSTSKYFSDFMKLIDIITSQLLYSSLRLWK